MEQLTGENRSAETVLSGLTGELDQVSAKIEALQEERRKADEAGRDQERRKAALDLQRLEQEKDLAHLADLLGHSSIETTRIYVAVSARAHEQILEKMRLIV